VPSRACVYIILKEKMSISFKRPVAIIKPIIVTQPPVLRAIAAVEELEDNIEKIKETFPDIAFTLEAVDERQKFMWRSQKQIDLCKWKISEWEAKMQEFKSIEVYDIQFVDLARRLKIAQSANKKRFISDDDDEDNVKSNNVEESRVSKKNRKEDVKGNIGINTTFSSNVKQVNKCQNGNEETKHDVDVEETKHDVGAKDPMADLVSLMERSFVGSVKQEVSNNNPKVVGAENIRLKKKNNSLLVADDDDELIEDVLKL